MPRRRKLSEPADPARAFGASRPAHRERPLALLRSRPADNRATPTHQPLRSARLTYPPSTTRRSGRLPTRSSVRRVSWSGKRSTGTSGSSRSRSRGRRSRSSCHPYPAGPAQPAANQATRLACPTRTVRHSRPEMRNRLEFLTSWRGTPPPSRDRLRPTPLPLGSSGTIGQSMLKFNGFAADAAEG
jgi:hypothetical protein